MAPPGSRLLGPLLGLALCLGCAERAPVPDYTDLLERARALERLDGTSVRILTWDLGGDHRPLLFQHPPSRVVLGPLPAGEGCRLRFAIGIRPPAWEKTDGVEFRVKLVGDGSEHAVFDELLVPSAGDEPRWLEREVALDPPAGQGPVEPRELVFETGPGPAGLRAFDHAGWAAPHVVCTRMARPVRPERPHVVLISVDTLRADHLGAYGYPRPTSPHLDRLARESLVFENAFSVSPWTLPSHASMFTGLEPHQHGAGHRAPLVPLEGGVPTLAELLSAAGYRTLGFSAGGVMSRRNGLDRGFESWTEHTRANLASMLPAVLAAMGAAPDRPTFLFLHTYDVHGPYSELPGVEPLPGDRAPQATEAGEWERIRSVAYHRYQKLERFGGVEDVVAAYDAGIRWVDARLGVLLTWLRETGAYDEALIVVTSDHGETLYERGLYLGHSYTLYDNEIRVPLMVRFPAGALSGRTRELVSLVDLLPLILGAVGLEAPQEIAGQDPMPRVAGDAPARPWVVGEATHTGARYARSLRWKVIGRARGADDGSRLPAQLRDRFIERPQLYDVGGDPAERHDLQLGAESARGEVELLYQQVQALPRPGGGADARVPDSAEARQLRALGYVE